MLQLIGLPPDSPEGKQKLTVMCVFGTRPEAIKMAPVVHALGACKHATPIVCVTAQHREMLDQVLSLFEITPDYDLDIMQPNQGLPDLTGAVLTGVGAVIRECRPDVVLVHGDTTTALGASLAAYYEHVPVGHVEAGLRSRNIYSPWPEEVNRRVVGVIAAHHYAPTPSAEENLLREGVTPGSIRVTGNTVIDTLLGALELIESKQGLTDSIASSFSFLDPTKRLLLVTGHRRENFDGGLERLCHALSRIAQRGDVEVVYPVHLNPRVRQTVESILAPVPGVFLIEPVDYLSFVYLMKRSYLILTDSGGIQEEAPSLRKPVLVLREETERPEAVAAGTARVIGTDAERIVTEVMGMLDDSDEYRSMICGSNPYGDGRASERIVAGLLESAIMGHECE